MPVYYYTPLWDGDYTDPDTGEVTHERSPGVEVGGVASRLDELPPGISKIHYDDSVPRTALAIVETQTIDGWTEQTKAQVDTDYPGVF